MAPSERYVLRTYLPFVSGTPARSAGETKTRTTIESPSLLSWLIQDQNFAPGLAHITLRDLFSI